MVNQPKPGPGIRRAIPDLVSKNEDEACDLADAGDESKLRDPFHSAVNRIPLLRPSLLREVRTNSDLKSFFGDGIPVGHDLLAPDRWSGSFVLEMTARTPIVFGEVAGQSDDRSTQATSSQKRVTLPFFRYKDEEEKVTEEYFIPSTAIKGMLSRQYEILTASRFRVFGHHKTPLTYRADFVEAGPLLLARVVKSKGVLAVKYPSSLRATIYSIPDTPEIAKALDVDLKQFRQMLTHGDQFIVRIRENEKGKQYVCGVVKKIRPGEKLKIKDGEAVGYVFRVAAEGAGSEALRPQGADQAEEASDKGKGGKKYEKLVFVGTANESTVSVLTEVQIQRYQRILASYVDEHSKREPNKPDQRKAWERSLNRAASELRNDPERTLQVGDFVFMVPRGPEGKTDFSQFDIVPTMLGRREYDIAPWALAAEQKVLPLSRKEEASPADRLFGYVVDTRLHGEDGVEIDSCHDKRSCVGDVAYRGRLSFSKVMLRQSDVVTDSPQLLPPLLSAKLGSARRFITDGNGHTPNIERKALRRSEYYRESSGSEKENPDSQRQLLGIAAFPVHRRLLGKSGFPTWDDADTNDLGLDSDNTNVRLVAENWIRPGAVLKCRVDFINLDSRELSALLWLLKPENLVPAAEGDKKDAKGYLRLGLGKPLGLGALEVRVQAGTLRARRGSDMQRHYLALEGCLGLPSDQADATELPELVDEEMRRKPWVQAMLRAAYGYDDKCPVRYMTLAENSDNIKPGRDGNFEFGDAISPRTMWGPNQAKPLRVIDRDKQAKSRRRGG